MTQTDGGPDVDVVRRRSGPWGLLRRWRAVLVLVPLLGGVLVAAVLGARMLYADVDEGPAATTVVCWDGSELRGEDGAATACSLPAGEEGLHWVFPSYDEQTDSCRTIERRAREAARPVELGCELEVAGRPVQVTYSIRTSVESGLGFLRRVYDGIEPDRVADGERLVFRDPDRTEEGYRLAVAYADYPYVVTVAAPTATVRDQALKDLVRFRPVAELSTRPAPPPTSGPE